MKGIKMYYGSIVLCACVALSSVYIGCSERLAEVNTSPTDVVIIKDINTHISAANGAEKTRGLIDLVSMSHRKHELAGVQCFTCHHKKGNDDRIKECAQCHKGGQGEKVMHDFCITCHSQKAKGPVMCQDCHLVSREHSEHK